MIMLPINTEIPKASRYVPNVKIDEIALEANRAYRSKSGTKLGFPIDMDRFLDLLEVSTVWEDIEEPEGAAFFASYSPENDGLITINHKHRELFESRPDVYCACLGHEGGHCILRHCDIFASASNTPSLFDDYSPAPIIFHKSSWHQFGLTREEVQKSKEERRILNETLAMNALVSETARRTLDQIQTHFEPEWVFWQAEHFSLCLRIPRDRLLEQLEEGWNFNSWSPIYRLAERFGVSASMMRARLEKLDVIELGPDGRPRPKPAASQKGLFH
jgi:hypothetical protein